MHVPGLDCDLFSGTHHGTIDTGHSVLICDGMAHLTYLDYSLLTKALDNHKLAFTLQPMNNDDLDIPSHLCDGGSEDDIDLTNFAERLRYINRVFKPRHSGWVMAHAQYRKASSNQLKQTLGAINCKNQSAYFERIDESRHEEESCDKVNKSHLDAQTESRHVPKSQLDD